MLQSRNLEHIGAGQVAESKLWSSFDFGSMKNELQRYCSVQKNSRESVTMASTTHNSCTACGTCCSSCNTSMAGCK